MNVFKPNNFAENFVWGVKNAITSRDWSMFFRVFGTHFTYEVSLGGRALQETSFTYEAMEKMNALTVDISIAAKARFAKFFMDASYDWKKHTE
jgi:hypothetical protein